MLPHQKKKFLSCKIKITSIICTTIVCTLVCQQCAWNSPDCSLYCHCSSIHVRVGYPCHAHLLIVLISVTLVGILGTVYVNVL